MENAVKYRFHHRHLVVDDVEKTVTFYRDVLGARKVQEVVYRGRPIVGLEMEGMSLTISNQLHAGVNDHIGLTVDNFEAAIAELRKSGVEFVIEPTVQDTVKYAFFKDAAGTILELVKFAGPYWDSTGNKTA